MTDRLAQTMMARVEDASTDPSQVLAEMPDAPRSRELWMQHTIGYVLMLHLREYAAAAIPQDASPEAQKLAMRVLDTALFGLMEICDGYNVPLRNDTYDFEVDLVGKVRKRDDDTVIATQTRGEGDGACMGVHFWLDGDFGGDPPVRQPRTFAPQSDWLSR